MAEIPRIIRLAAFLVALAAVVAVAGPPLVTDDPETPGRRGWEVNLSHNFETARGARLMELPLVDVNYGPRENDQLKIEFAVLSLDPADARDQYGVGDMLLGYKYRFVEEETAGWMASIYPQVSVPTGNRHLDLGSGHAELLVPFQFGKHFLDERLLVYAELGYNAVLGDHDADYWKLGIAGEWRVTEKLGLLSEIGGLVFPRNADPDDVFFNLGLKYELAKHAAFIGSAGRSFRDRQAGTPDFTSFLGVQFLWGGDQAE